MSFYFSFNKFWQVRKVFCVWAAHVFPQPLHMLGMFLSYKFWVGKLGLSHLVWDRAVSPPPPPLHFSGKHFDTGGCNNWMLLGGSTVLAKLFWVHSSCKLSLLSRSLWLSWPLGVRFLLEVLLFLQQVYAARLALCYPLHSSLSLDASKVGINGVTAVILQT